MKGYQIHLIAHGMPDTPKDVLYLGRTDTPLSARGVRELETIAKKMIYPEVDGVYCGPLMRCRQTAQLLYPQEHPLIDDQLTELDTGIFTGKPVDQLQKNMYFKDWLKAGLTYEIPEGERGEDFLRRCLDAYANIFANMAKQGQNSVAVITHPGVILCLLGAAGVPKYNWSKMPIAPGTGWTTIATADMWMRSMAFEVFAPLPQPLEDLSERDAANGPDHEENVDQSKGGACADDDAATSDKTDRRG